MLANTALPELVLSFHGIGEAPADKPADEVPYWIGAEAFAAFAATAARWRAATGTDVLFTFDDGNASDLAVAAPLLAAHGLRGAFYACTGRIGQAGYLGAEDLRALAALGFEVGSHGVDHVAWSSLGGAELAREVQSSRAVLGEILGAPVASAALPFGGYNRRVLAEARRAGYRTVYSSDPGCSPPGRWLCRRWTYRSGEPFDLGTMASRSRSPGYRLKLAAKELIKSWR